MSVHHDILSLVHAQESELLPGPNLQVCPETNLLILSQTGVAFLLFDQIDRAR